MLEILQKIKLKFKKILKYKKSILSFIFFSLILGYIYHYNIPVKYKAEINFVLDDEKSGAASGAGLVASQLGIDIGGGSSGIFSGDNLIYLFKSKRILDKTLISRKKIGGKEISLADYYLQNFYPTKYKKDIFNHSLSILNYLFSNHGNTYCSNSSWNISQFNYCLFYQDHSPI